MIKIIRAAEPSDVVWENAGFTTSEKYWRRVAGVIFAFFVLMVFFGIITVLSHYQTTALKSNTSPFGPFLNGLVSFAVVVLNYALCFIMKKISL